MIHARRMRDALPRIDYLDDLYVKLALVRQSDTKVHLAFGPKGTHWDNLRSIELTRVDAEKVVLQLIEGVRKSLHDDGIATDDPPSMQMSPDEPS